MELLDILRQANGGQAIATLARQFDIDPRQAEAALASVLPEISRGIERNTLSRGGLADLVGAIGKGGHERYLDNPALLNTPETQRDGIGILNHVLGTKDASRAAAARASQASDVSEALIESMLPAIAAMAMAGVARQTKQSFGDIFAQIPNIGGGGGGGNFGGGGGFGTGSGGGGGFGGGSPLPVPDRLPTGGSGGGGSNPYGDLSDIIRRGGGSIGGSPLGNMVRQILGGALGFGGGGVLSWIIRMVVTRYGWTILRSIFGRAFTGR